jgi:uncharacterized protein
MNWRLVILGMVMPVLAWAQEMPAPLTDNISDFADLLPPEDEARIADQIQKLRDATGVHLVVATMDKIESHGGKGQTIEAYAKALFNQWGIGDPTKNDGILMLVVRDDRVTRIALGSGYDAVYDGRAARVVDTAMLPAFRQNNYVQGIEAGVASAADRIIAPFLKNQPVTETSGFPETKPSWTSLIPIGMFLAFAGVFFRRFIGDQAARLKKCENCNQRGLQRSREVTTAATIGTAGIGMLRDHCQNCGHDHLQNFTVAATRKSGGNGGSGGFGGGKSSGGGATGRW